MIKSAIKGANKKESNKVILVFPNIRWSDKNISNTWTIWPNNLCILAAMLEPGYEVIIIDANIDDMTREEFKARIAKEKPMAVGISIFADEFGDGGHEAARIVKEINPGTPVIAGGNYIILNIDIAIKDRNIDYFALGEGEYVLKHLAEYISGKRKDLPNEGIAYHKDGKPIIQKRCEQIKDLNALPFPAFEKIDFAKYSTKEVRDSAYRPDEFPYGRIITSRGCPYNCSFCQNKAIHGQLIRYRSVEKVLEEIEWMKKNHNIKSILFDDANFTVNKNRAKEIIREMIKRKLNLRWKAMNLAVFTLDGELLDLMLKSGCDYIDLAIESGVQRVLKEIIHKPVNLEQTKKIIKKAKEMNFRISANFIIGTPGETWDEIRQTIKFAEEIDIDYVKFMAAMPLKHTELAEVAMKQGCLRPDFDFLNMRWGIGEIETDEFSKYDITILRIYEWDRINFSTPEKMSRAAKVMGIDNKKINKMRRDTRKSIKEIFAKS